MNFITSLKYSGDSLLCSKYSSFARIKAEQLAQSLSSNEKSSIKNFQLSDFLEGKLCYVNINISINLPFININIWTDVKGRNLTGNYSSGLSIYEINDNNNFSQFYPKDGDGFQDWSLLFKNSQIDSLLPFYKTYKGKNINQNHYIFGNQFTGQMSKEVQNIIATNDTNCKYVNFWGYSQGIYIDSKKNPWLITIKNDGLFVRQLNYKTYKDGTTDGRSSGSIQPPVDRNVLDGIGFIDTDIKLLDMGFFYSGASFISDNQGWAFNKKGNLIQNVNVRGISDFNTNRYQITITENIVSDTVSLLASFSLIETGVFKPTRLDSFICPLSINNNQFFPEEISNFNYRQSKLSPIQMLNFNQSNFTDFTKISSLDENIYKCPISVYFDDNDEVKVLYYYLKKTLKSPTTSSTTGITSVDDFFFDKTGTFNGGNIEKLGDLTVYNQVDTTTFSLEQINATLKHGFMFNNDESTLAIDNLGDLTEEYEIKLADGTALIDDFAYQVANGFTPDLTPYYNFSLNTELLSSQNKISDYINEVNNFNINYKRSDGNTTTKAILAYNLHQQVININKFFDSFDNGSTQQIYRLDTIKDLFNLTEFKKLELRDINNPTLLYNVNSDIYDVFTGINSTSVNNFDTKIDSALTILNTLNSSTFYMFYQNMTKDLSNFYIYLMNIKDPINYNKIELNNAINQININTVDMNLTIDIINNYITTINNVFTSTEITTITNLVDSYNSILDTYNSNDGNNSPFITLSNRIRRINTSTTSFDDYYYGNMLANIILKDKKTIKNKKLTNQALVFNYGNRNAYSIYKEENNFDDINYYNNKFDTFLEKNSVIQTNSNIFYKQSGIISGSVETKGDFIVEGSQFYNPQTIMRTDYLGNTFSITGGEGSSSFPNDLIYLRNTFNSNRYVDVFLQGFSNISQLTLPYHLTNRKYHYEYYSINYNSTTTKNIYTYLNNNVISQSSTVNDNDYRLVVQNLSLRNWDSNYYLNNYYKYYKNDGSLYFNFVSDVYSYNYVISKDFYSYSQNNEFLTNITKYPSITVIMPVNFIGVPF